MDTMALDDPRRRFEPEAPRDPVDKPPGGGGMEGIVEPARSPADLSSGGPGIEPERTEAPAGKGGGSRAPGYLGMKRRGRGERGRLRERKTGGRPSRLDHLAKSSVFNPKRNMTRQRVEELYRPKGAQNALPRLQKKFGGKAMREIKELQKRIEAAGSGGLFGTTGRKELSRIVADALGKQILDPIEREKKGSGGTKPFWELVTWLDSNDLIIVSPESRENFEKRKSDLEAQVVDLLAREFDQIVRWAHARAENTVRAHKREAFKKDSKNKGRTMPENLLPEKASFPQNGLVAYLAHKFAVPELQRDVLQSTLLKFKERTHTIKSTAAKEKIAKAGREVRKREGIALRKKELERRIALALHLEKFPDNIKLMQARKEKLEKIVKGLKSDDIKSKPFTVVPGLLQAFTNYIALAGKYTEPEAKGILEKLRLRSKELSPVPEVGDISQMSGLFKSGNERWNQFQNSINSLVKSMPEAWRPFWDNVDLDKLNAPELVSLLQFTIGARRSKIDVDKVLKEQQLGEIQKMEVFLKETPAKLRETLEEMKAGSGTKRSEIRSWEQHIENIEKLFTDPDHEPEHRDNRIERYTRWVVSKGFARESSA